CRNFMRGGNDFGRVGWRTGGSADVHADAQGALWRVLDVFRSLAVDESQARRGGARGYARFAERRRSVNRRFWLDGGVLVTGLAGGIASGMFGIGGGTIMVPILGLLLGFSQHRAQGTSLVALIPPTGLLAVLAYGKAGFVDWRTGLLLVPGVFLGGI